MTVLQEVINQLREKRESRLNNEKTAREKMFVLAHERLAVWILSMSQYATQQQVDYGDRAAVTAELWQCGNVGTMSTTLTAGVGA